MAKDYYLPPGDGAKAIWLNTLAEKISVPGSTEPTAGEDLGLSAAQVAQTVKDAAMFSFCIQNQDSFKNEKEERTDYKNLVRSGAEGVAMDPYPTTPPVSPPETVPQGVFRRSSQNVAHIKSHKNYSTAIGEDWGIIGDDQVFDENELKPDIELLVVAIGVLVKWDKGFAEAIRIYVDRGSGFVWLATDGEPDYLDTFAMPAEAATWKYKAVYEIDGEAVGLFSEQAEVEVKAAV